MKLRMLSLLSIVIALSIKSLDISAADYHKLRVMMNVVPADYLYLMPYEMETELDSVVYQLAIAPAVMERYVGIECDTITEEFRAFERLKMLATEEQLNELLVHESPIVKVYAHRALLHNEMNMNCEAELALLEDSTCVDWYVDDEMTNTTVMEMINLAYIMED